MGVSPPQLLSSGGSPSLASLQLKQQLSGSPFMLRQPSQVATIPGQELLTYQHYRDTVASELSSSGAPASLDLIKPPSLMRSGNGQIQSCAVSSLLSSKVAPLSHSNPQELLRRNTHSGSTLVSGFKRAQPASGDDSSSPFGVKRAKREPSDLPLSSASPPSSSSSLLRAASDSRGLDRASITNVIQGNDGPSGLYSESSASGGADSDSDDDDDDASHDNGVAAMESDASSSSSSMALKDPTTDDTTSLHAIRPFVREIRSLQELCISQVAVQFPRLSGERKLADIPAAVSSRLFRAVIVGDRLRTGGSASALGYRIHSNNIATVLRGCSGLKHLDLSGVQHLSPTALAAAIAEVGASLESLSLASMGPEAVTNEVLAEIGTRCSKLEVLDLSHAYRITDSGFVALFAAEHGLQPRQLRSLVLRSCYNLTKQGLAAFSLGTSNTSSAVASATVQHEYALVEMNLENCHYLDDEALGHLAYACPKLAKIDLYGCSTISIIGVKCLVSRCPQLQSISLAFCNQLGDGVLRALALLGSRLRDLNLRECTSITDWGVDLILQHCTELRSLSLAQCISISDRGVRRLPTCVSLVEVRSRACPGRDAAAPY